MAVVFVEDLTEESCVACAPSDFGPAQVADRVNETHPARMGREWKVSHSNVMPDGQANPCSCKHMMGRRHWRLNR